MVELKEAIACDGLWQVLELRASDGKSDGMDKPEGLSAIGDSGEIHLSDAIRKIRIPSENSSLI